MNLSKTEKKILNAMAESAQINWSPEQIADVVYADGRRRPKHWRGSIMAMMRYLAIKTKYDDRYLKISRNGESATARYTLLKQRGRPFADHKGTNGSPVQ